MERKILLIIDPQIDFITGSLPVAGAESAMNRLACYIRENSADYSQIIVTADRHPMRHCSFKSEGGPWPVHCVADSVGAAIWTAIMTELIAVADKTTVLHKGEDPAKEEYSIFQNAYAARRILEIIESEKVAQVDICGLAGDICVADTVRDAITLIPNSRLNILTRFSPSLDSGKTLSALIAINSLSSDI